MNDLEDILFDVYTHGAENKDCDLTERAKLIRAYANKMVAKELKRTLLKLSYFSQDLNDRLYEFKHKQEVNGFTEKHNEK